MPAETREMRAITDSNTGDVIRTAIDTLRELIDSLIMVRELINEMAE
jgi:hypothetical protein